MTAQKTTLFILATIVLSSICIDQVSAGIGGLLGLGGKGGFGSKKTSEMLVAASILASLISKHKDAQNQNKRPPMHIPVPVPAHGGYGGGYGGYGAASGYSGGYSGGLGASLYGGYPGFASYGGGFASPTSYGGYGGYGAPGY